MACIVEPERFVEPDESFGLGPDLTGVPAFVTVALVDEEGAMMDQGRRVLIELSEILIDLTEALDDLAPSVSTEIIEMVDMRLAVDNVEGCIEALTGFLDRHRPFDDRLGGELLADHVEEVIAAPTREAILELWTVIAPVAITYLAVDEETEEEESSHKPPFLGGAPRLSPEMRSVLGPRGALSRQTLDGFPVQGDDLERSEDPAVTAKWSVVDEGERS